ncbi:hypothetical protein SBA6_60080 [Candidatus Sulfopaludibacter sp. SbA6]|nr:hypothetical protein SBA6_60080 [Candidatus Sulfopaludibacter sp. SbA6]
MVNHPCFGGMGAREDGMLCSILVSVRSTSSIPSSVPSSSAGARLSRSGNGVDSQWVAFCSSPNTATAWAITGTKRATAAGDVISLILLRRVSNPAERKETGTDAMVVVTLWSGYMRPNPSSWSKPRCFFIHHIPHTPVTLEKSRSIPLMSNNP